jgi:hypothetical protein
MMEENFSLHGSQEAKRETQEGAGIPNPLQGNALQLLKFLLLGFTF